MPQQTAVSKPDHIVDAMRQGNIPHLSEEGRKGGRSTQRRKRNRILLDLQRIAEQANEHICPVGED